MNIPYAIRLRRGIPVPLPGLLAKKYPSAARSGVWTCFALHLRRKWHRLSAHKPFGEMAEWLKAAVC